MKSFVVSVSCSINQGISKVIHTGSPVSVDIRARGDPRQTDGVGRSTRGLELRGGDKVEAVSELDPVASQGSGQK